VVLQSALEKVRNDLQRKNMEEDNEKIGQEKDTNELGNEFLAVKNENSKLKERITKMKRQLRMAEEMVSQVEVLRAKLDQSNANLSHLKRSITLNNHRNKSVAKILESDFIRAAAEKKGACKEMKNQLKNLEERDICENLESQIAFLEWSIEMEARSVPELLSKMKCIGQEDNSHSDFNKSISNIRKCTKEVLTATPSKSKETQELLFVDHHCKNSNFTGAQS